MRTIGVIARKGGSGKTTIALHIALATWLRGSRTLIADTDPQRSAKMILEARCRTGPDLAVTSGPKLYPLQLNALRSGVDTMVVDTPAAIDEEIINVVALADMCLLVVRPTFLDLTAAVQTLQIVATLRKPILAVVNQAPPTRMGVETSAVSKALKALAAMQLPVAPIIVRSRAIYQVGLESGLSAEEAGDAGAAQEIAALWSFVERFTARALRKAH